MSVAHYYDLCNRHKGKGVEIRTKDGRVHRGIIQHVNQRKVYIQPMGGGRNLGGFGYGFYGPGFGGGGLGIGIALGAIGTLALLPWFFW
ncbi:ATP synthase alpha/beta family, beta-barrel domain [Oceanobacillus limi]|uniref:ATP synthase alpha/beta family, beta-barrel domain n=1 Tax=Oceanobacillus limi TaxID=930131 RepID=A0A1I0GA77_9BACI|nr:hypothetical protein [Oceanobacillus limi]SET67682.1 ATP synthase alpha/beta family, beta-barrel domain [Oceanobacillus limi]